MIRFAILLVALFAATTARAQCPNGNCPNGNCSNARYVVTASTAQTPGTDYKIVATPEQVLEEVNAQRRARGLPPYIFDAGLARGAFAAAMYRAKNGIEGHTKVPGGDFAFLPSGARADAAGCARWQVGTGFGACAMYETEYHHAGAAFVTVGNQRYMHLFVRR